MKKKVRITLPKAKSGVSLSATPGTHPITGQNQLSPGAFFPSTNFTEPNTEVNHTLKPTEKENANLEAEKGETVVTNLAQTGIPEFYTIGGKRHHAGGTPLNLPPDSFIFSRDKKLAVKDKDILAQFGKNVGKKGKKKYIFAELSKSFDLNPWREILAKRDSDHHMIKTAEMMIENNNKKLGALALMQESKKGFPNGIPGIAMPYLMATGMAMDQILPQQQQQTSQPMKWGGVPQYGPGGPYEELETADPYPAEMFANVRTFDQAAELLKGYRQASGATTTPEQQLKLTNVGTQAYWDAVRKYAGVESEAYAEDGVSGWRAVQKPTVPVGHPLSTKPFVPGFKYENDQLFQKRQGKVTGEEHWEASNPTMARLYAKKYGTGELTGKELTQQIKENPEAFASSWGKQAADDAQVAAITLKEKGGPINEADYMTALDAQLMTDPTIYTAQPMYNESLLDESSYTNPLGKRRVRVSMPGTTPQTSTKVTRVQNIPNDGRKWDMTAEGYDENSVRAGDYIKKADDKWYQAETVKPTPYEGNIDERLGDLGEAYGRLEKRILGNEKLQNAMYKKYKANMAKAKPRNNLSEADLEKARGLSKEEVVSNFLRAQKQIMAIQAKGPLKNADAWDKDLRHYEKAMTDLDFVPMTAAETAAFQGAYISMQNLADADPEFRKELNDFLISEKTRKGKADEPGGGTGKATISDIDGWFGNTTIGESLLYAPKAKELEMKEVAWDEVKDDPDVKHMKQQYAPGKTPFWTEDIINLGFAAKNLFGIRREEPWMAKPVTRLPRPTFLSPQQQIQNILGATAQGIKGATAYGSPQAYAANVANMQANAMQHVANAVGNVHDRNVQVANQFELQRNRILNQANVRDAQLATTMHDKNAVLNQQFRNAKNQAWDTVRRMGVNMWTNRGMTQNLNTFTDQYDIDPMTGFKYFTDPRALTPKDTQPFDLTARTNQLLHDVPGLTPDKAVELAMKENQGSTASTQFTGADLSMAGQGYPGGVGNGYYPG